MTTQTSPGACNRRKCSPALYLLVSCGLVTCGTAEEIEIVLPPGVVLPPGIILPASAATNRVAEPKSPADKLLQDLLKLKFDRTPASILVTLAEQFDESKSADRRIESPSPVVDPLNPRAEKPEGAGVAKEVEQFRQLVIAGNWPKVGEFLRGLTNDHGKQVYRHLLRELPNASRPQPSGAMPPDQPPMPVPQPGGQGPASLRGPTLVVDDILDLAEAAAHELEAEDARLLGHLLGRLLTRGDALEPLLPKLDVGVKGLGGNDPAARSRAAELLVAANRLIEAGPFLLPADQAREQKDWAALDLRARQLIALGTAAKDSKLLTEAWEINQFILASPGVASSNREPALRRSFELMPLLSREVGTNWLRRGFQQSPHQGLVLLAAVGDLVQKGFTDRSAELRQRNLELQKQVVETFLDVADPAQPHWQTALNLLAQNWMQEANWSRQRHQPPRNYGPQYDEFGNMVYYEPYPPNLAGGNQNPAIAAGQVLFSAPGTAWLAQLDTSLRVALHSLMADLCLKAEKTDDALEHLEAVALVNPRGATDLANEFLRVWTRMRNPTQQPRQMAYGPYGPIYYSSGMMMRGGGISLTRAMQARNIREMAGLLNKLAALRLPSLNDEVVVGAFAAAHSPAEVFRTEDIEAVFGPLDRIKLETLAGLTQTMRERLASQWRQPRIQQQAKTERTDRQIEAEVLRGYDVVLRLLEDGLQREPDHWQMNLSRAAVYFDLAEFQYGKKVDLAIYVEKREQAFKGFQRAAALYAAALPHIEEKEQTPRVYQQWFNANLGASDLAYVTRQQEPETNQLQRIRAAMLSLPGGAAERHLSAFAKSLGQSVNTLRPELKPRYLRAGLRIVGDHPDAEDARKVARYYDDLLQEIEFVVRVDGDATVGHTRPFGVFVSLRHTADIEREAGGFARYLRNLKRTSYMYYNPYGQQQQRNFVEDFDKQVREKLVDKFDVKSVTFLDEKVQSRGYGRPGWRETPLAYLLVQAKDASVDQLPGLHMDLDFMDQRGQVVLPVASQIILLDARPTRVAARPVTDLEVTQLLDDRELEAGRLTLEVKAQGRGLVPELSELVRTNFTHLRIEEISDQGLSVAQIDTEGDEIAPVTERNWLLKLRVAEDAPASLTFQFPETAVAAAKMIFKRYADADLVEVEPKLALAGLPLRPRPWWHWLALGAVLLMVAGGVAWWLRRQQPALATARPLYTLPEPATPFTVMSLLRRMQADASLRWSEADRTELAQSIQRLEAHFFARERNGDPELDLVGIGRRWVELAGNGK
ncbi:MAG: hypothetical protein KJ070_24365 [Verrucomicrobia bacterium]|nr:hypothetical protein [Verrucomicrobiota bacterium]